MRITTSMRKAEAIQARRPAAARLHCVVFAPDERRQVLDKLMSEQGQCWVGRAAQSRGQIPLVKCEFFGDVDRINPLNRAVTSMLQSPEVKFYTFVVPQ